MSKIKIRNLNKEDILKCIKLFRDTVHAINTNDYSSEQVNIWAPESIDPSDERWQSLLTNISTGSPRGSRARRLW